jgi:hypothetical protein
LEPRGFGHPSACHFPEVVEPLKISTSAPVAPAGAHVVDVDTA